MATLQSADVLAGTSAPLRLRLLIDRLVKSCKRPPTRAHRFDDWKRGRRHPYDITFRMLMDCADVGGSPHAAIAVCEEFISRLRERVELPPSFEACQRLLLDADQAGDRAREEAAIGGATTDELKALDLAMQKERGVLDIAHERVRLEMRKRECGQPTRLQVV